MRACNGFGDTWTGVETLDTVRVTAEDVEDDYTRQGVKHTTQYVVDVARRLLDGRRGESSSDTVLKS